MTADSHQPRSEGKFPRQNDLPRILRSQNKVGEFSRQMNTLFATFAIRLFFRLFHKTIIFAQITVDFLGNPLLLVRQLVDHTHNSTYSVCNGVEVLPNLSNLYSEAKFLEQKKFSTEALRNFEPLVGRFMQFIVLIAELPRSDTLFQCLCLSSGPIFVSAANVECPSISCS